MSERKFVTDRSAVRKRPGMWIGWTSGRGRLALTYEVIENTIDQAAGGSASLLEVTLGDDRSIEIVDDGNGLDLASATVRSFFVEHHDSPSADGHAPHLHFKGVGVGLFVVNALSERLVCESNFEGAGLRCSWSDGGLNERGPTTANIDRGTRVKFWPDGDIFDDGGYPVAELVTRLNQYAALFPALRIRCGRHDWPAEAATQSLQRLLPARGVPTMDAMYFEGTDQVSTGEQMELRCLFRQNPAGAEGVLICFVNTRQIVEARGLMDQIGSAFRDCLAASTVAHSPERSYESMDVVLAVNVAGAQFDGPTKQAMVDPEVVAVVDRILHDELPSVLRAAAS